MPNTFKRNLYFAYGVSLTLLLITAIASYISIKNLLYSIQLVNHTNEVVKKVESVLTVLQAAETSQRGYLLTGKDSFLEPFNGAYQRTLDRINEVTALTSDNPIQQQSCDDLKAIAQKRLSMLNTLVNRKKVGLEISDSMLVVGRDYMLHARTVIDTMKNREENLLKVRTDNLNRFSSSTPVLIVVASLLAIIITLVSLFKVTSDFDERVKLQTALQKKDKEISARLDVIEKVAEQISAGNYKIKVEDEGDDALGGIAESLNKMAASLDVSFTQLSDREWLQSGLANLNESVIGEQEMTSLAREVLNFVVEYTDSQAGAFYVLNKEEELVLKSGYALSSNYRKMAVRIGDELVGQAARKGKPIEVTGFSDDDYTLSYISVEVRPKAVIAVPLLFNKEVKGVIELAAMQPYSSVKKSFLKSAAFTTGIGIQAVQSREKVQELLEETQAQAEELQAQHSELENINSELEAQAEKLQASEEELKVQQEELQQANQELEERSRLLEEKNELILERNLEIQRKADDLALSTRYKSEFLANMSHELRTPLNSSLILAKLLADNPQGNLTEEQVQFAQTIRSSGNDLLTLINDILDLSKIEAGRMDVRPETVRISQLVEGLNRVFDPIVGDKGLKFATSIANDCPAEIETDWQRLEQVLKNLLSNAVKFTEAGQVTLSVGRAQDGRVTFAVTDTGIGIPEQQQQVVFEAFRQADGTTNRKYGGTGLGLSISRELVRLLGGDLHLTSQPGQGSTFTVTLPEKYDARLVKPRSPAEAKPPVGVVESTRPASPMASPSPRPTPALPTRQHRVKDDRDTLTRSQRVILVVEDDESFARILSDLAHELEFQCLIATTAEEGLALAAQFLPSAVILDVGLPDHSGLTVLDRLKHDNRLRHIPVHVVSASDSGEAAMALGAIGYVVKPVDRETLIEALRKLETTFAQRMRRVLVVEDDMVQLDSLKRLLSTQEVETVGARSVAECLQLLKEGTYDCMVLDLSLPDASGYSLLETLSQEDAYSFPPVIVYTGRDLSEADEQQLRRYSKSIIIKGAKSPERLLDEVTLFLHQVVSELPPEQQRMLEQARSRDSALEGRRVLIVEDDVRNVFALTSVLEPRGLKVQIARNGREALSALETSLSDPDLKIDLVLMDVMMPEMDGLTATRALRQRSEWKKLPVIMLTAKAMRDDQENCLAAGASDYLAKPLDVEKLLSLVRVWMPR